MWKKKKLDKNPIPLYDKNIQQVTEETSLSLMKSIYENSMEIISIVRQISPMVRDKGMFIFDIVMQHCIGGYVQDN